jgi:DNA-binding NarL/FixJ family response regulator
MISTGLSNKEIARHVGLTEGTVKAHLYNIYKKLGLSSRSGLAAIALGLNN